MKHERGKIPGGSLGRANKGGDRVKDGITPPPPRFYVTRWSGSILIMFISDFLDPGQGRNEAGGPEPGRRARAPHPRRAGLSPGRSCACRAPVRLRAGFVWRVRKGLFGGRRRRERGERLSRRETLQAQPPPLTPSLNRVPPRRAWPTVRPPLPNTHTKLIKPNSGGRDAPCSAKAEAPPCGAQGCSPIPGSLYPPPGASQGTPSQPGGNFGVRGSKPTGPAASWRPFAPIAQCGSRAREEQCGSPLHPGHS